MPGTCVEAVRLVHGKVLLRLEENSWPLLDAYSPNEGGATVVLPLHAQCCFKGLTALLIPLGREIASVGFSDCLTAFEGERERIAVRPHPFQLPRRL